MGAKVKKKPREKRLPKHKCPFCEMRHDRAVDSMTHVTMDHRDETAFRRFEDRGYSRREKQEPCPQCGTMFMPTIVSGCVCGYEVPSS